MQLEQAIQLISFEGELKLTEEACQVISQIKSNIGVICIAGNHKSGKSYLLNKLFISKGSGFPVGNRIQPQTKGMMMYSQGLKGQTQDGQPIHYIIIDTEGLAELSKENHRNVQIITLAVLMSSVLIYNSVGAIDESAIQNLSLINHLANTILNDQDDCFPSFLWVLRDFSLQLQDSDGQSISAKEYMEKSLQQHRGFSDDIEQKNRIRRLICQLFKSRDCATLVRPANTEGGLQNLDTTQVRQEFQEQVVNLKRKIQQVVKPKKIRNLYLGGAQFIQLIKEYIKQLNQTTQINIQEVWNNFQDRSSYLCLNEALFVYEAHIKTLKLPTTTFEELKNHHKEAQQMALDQLRYKINDKGLEEELHTKCKQRVKQISQLNEKEAHALCTQFINKEFASLKRRIANGEYRSILEFERDIKLFYQFLLEHGPKTVAKQQVFQEFYNNMLSEGAQMFIKAIQTTTQVKQEYTKQDSQYEKIIAEKDSMINQLNERVKEIENQRNNLQFQISALEYKLNKSQAFKIQAEQLQEELQQVKEQFTSDHERQLILKESEYSKQRALLEQKVLQLSKQLESFQKKEIQMDSSFISTRSDHNIQIKEINTKYDQMIVNMQERLNSQNDQIQYQQEQIDKAEQQNQILHLKIQQKDQKLLDNQNKLQKLQNQLYASNDNQSSNCITDHEKELKYLRQLCDTQETQLKEKQDKLIYLKSNLEKEFALVSQEKQFLEQQLGDLKQQLSTQRKNYEQTIQLLESTTDMHKSQSVSRQIIELRGIHMNEIKQIEMENASQKKKLVLQVDMLSKENSELGIKVSQQQNEFNREMTILKNRLINAEDSLIKLNKEYMLVEQLQKRQQKEFEDKLFSRIKSHQVEIEDIKNKYFNEITINQLRYEEQVAQLRKMYDDERLKLEEKFLSDRLSMEEKFNQLIEEIEGQYQNNQDDEAKIIRKQLKKSELTLQQLQLHWQTENDIKAKQILQLENTNKELAAQVNKQDQQRQLQQQQIQQQQQQQLQQQQTLQQQQQQQQQSEILSFNATELLKYKQMVSQLESEKAEIESNYERDQLLWQGKLKFIMDQKEQAKQDLSEAMTKFEFTINHLQKVRTQTIEEEDNQMSEMLITLEKKYQLQLMDLSESNQVKVNELENRIRNYEQQVRMLQELIKQQPNSQQAVDELDRKYQYQLDQMRVENDVRIEELYLSMTEERQKYRTMLSEAEERYKDNETRKSNMIFEHEKERAKWSMEKDDLMYQRNELQEMYQRLQKKQDGLLKEIDRSRSDTKKQKRSGIIKSKVSPGKSPTALSNISKMEYSFEMYQQPSIDFTEDNTQKSIHLNPEVSFEAYYNAKGKGNE